MKYTAIIGISMLFLSACASHIPLEIRNDITQQNISIDAVHSDFNQYDGQTVRWGGMIASVENKASDTWLEVVGKTLNSSGRPIHNDKSLGRFIARVEGFLDPAIYKQGREITVYGTIESSLVKEIDEHPYTYPLVMAETYYLWRDYGRSRPHYAYDYPYYYYPYPYPYIFGIHIGHRFGLHYRFRH